MDFLNPGSPINSEQLSQCESVCGIRLPVPVRAKYLESNGGVPDPYVFQDDNLDTVISEFLPMVSESRGTAVEVYRELVTEKSLVPAHFFPFVVDGGGDYFFIDTQSEGGDVYFFNGDTDGDPLISLSVVFQEFWDALVPE